MLHAVDVGREGRHHHAFFVALKDAVERRRNDFFGRRVARTFRVGRITQQQPHALRAQLCEARQIDRLAVQGRKVDFEVAGVDHAADRSGDTERAGVRNRVVDTDEFNGENAGLDCLSGLDLHKVGAADVVFFKFSFDDAEGQTRAVDG